MKAKYLLNLLSVIILAGGVALAQQSSPPQGPDEPFERNFSILIEGGGFLWNQIRIMVGTLVEIGMGKYPPERIVEMLAARDRRAAGPTAPPEGLYLQWIKF